MSRSERAGKLRALGLIGPLFVFLLVVFIVPILTLLSRSVVDPIVDPVLPRTLEALSDWEGTEAPNDAVYAALVEDLKTVESRQILAQAASRVNHGLAGMRSLLISARTDLAEADVEDPRAALLELSPKWGEVGTWGAIRNAGGPLTDFYLLAALDLKRNAQGDVTRQPQVQRVFVDTIIRTFEISLGVTTLALVIGFPFAYLASTVSARWSRLLMFMVLLPFWTAVLVRTLSWAVLLQNQGVINQALTSFGLIDHPLPLIFNRFAVYISLVHIFLPFMVLPLYSVMVTVPQTHLRAAASLGARPFTAFRRVYLPQVGPGIAAGSMLVFIQCLGVFVTPAILGGPDDQGISYLIAFYVNKTLNWGMAASLSIILLTAVCIFYWLFSRLTGKTGVSLG